MDVTIYRTQDGRYVLTPQLFQPSMECRHRFETLIDCGQASIDDACRSEVWLQVLGDIERDTYAVLDPQAVGDLFGAGHRCLMVGTSAWSLPTAAASTVAMVADLETLPWATRNIDSPS